MNNSDFCKTMENVRKHRDINFVTTTKRNYLTIEFQYNYAKPKYKEKAKLCYKDTDRFIVYIKTETFKQTLQKMLKQDSILQIMNQTDRYQKEKTKK